eukprot:Gb_39686 [translate_table: standard]
MSLMSMRDNGEHSLQALSFQSLGMDPWMQMQQRIDSCLTGIQSDVYQGMPTVSVQETRSVDPSKQLNYQQKQPVLSEQLQCRPQLPLQNNIIEQQQERQHHQLQQQSLHLEQQQPQNHLLQQQLQRQSSQHHLVQQQLQNSFNEQQQPSFQQQQRQQLPFQQVQRQQQTFQMPNVVSSLPQVPSSKPQSSISVPSVCSQPVLTNTSANLASPTTSCSTSPLQTIIESLTSEVGSHYLNLSRPSQPAVQQSAENLVWPCISQDQQAPAAWFSSKRVSNNPVEAPLPSASQRVLSQTEPLAQSNIPVQSMPLTQFALRNCSSDQEGVQSDSQSNLLFGVNIDTPSLVITDTVSNSRNIGNGAYVGSSFSVTDLLNVPSCAPTSGFPMNSSIGASGGLDENGLSQHGANYAHINPPTRTFTKVYKLGSVGRSLDVTRFNGYQELRAELDRMFGLEGQLEDPQRSGWQLVFVDKEKDVLLLGDDPWEEFVNSVRFIKILSPPEVMQMSQEGIQLNSIRPQQQTSSTSEECLTRHDSHNISSVITSVGPLEY